MKKIPNYIEVEESMTKKVKDLEVKLKKIEEEEDVKFPINEINVRLANMLGDNKHWINYTLYFCIGLIILMVVMIWL